MLNTTWFGVPSLQAKVMQFWFDRDCGKSKVISELDSPIITVPDPKMDWKVKVKEWARFPQAPLYLPFFVLLCCLTFSSSLSLLTLV